MLSRSKALEGQSPVPLDALKHGVDAHWIFLAGTVSDFLQSARQRNRSGQVELAGAGHAERPVAWIVNNSASDTFCRNQPAGLAELQTDEFLEKFVAGMIRVPAVNVYSQPFPGSTNQSKDFRACAGRFAPPPSLP